MRLDWLSSMIVMRIVNARGRRFRGENNPGSLLDLVQQGEEVLITHHGKPVARLVREKDRSHSRKLARRAATTLAQLSLGVTIGRQSIKSLIEEGRR
jgi:prevent-host-death family protein